MYMVGDAVYLSEFNIIVARDGSEQFLHFFFGVGVGEYSLSILRGPCKVVPKIIPGVAGVTDGHIPYIVALSIVFLTIADIAL